LGQSQKEDSKRNAKYTSVPLPRLQIPTGTATKPIPKESSKRNQEKKASQIFVEGDRRKKWDKKDFFHGIEKQAASRTADRGRAETCALGATGRLQCENTLSKITRGFWVDKRQTGGPAYTNTTAYTTGFQHTKSKWGTKPSNPGTTKGREKGKGGYPIKDNQKMVGTKLLPRNPHFICLAIQSYKAPSLSKKPGEGGSRETSNGNLTSPLHESPGTIKGNARGRLKLGGCLTTHKTAVKELTKVTGKGPRAKLGTLHPSWTNLHQKPQGKRILWDRRKKRHNERSQKKREKRI